MKDRLDVITLRGLSAVGSHGVFEYERSGSQVFSADLKLYLDASKAAETDDVQYTVDYGAIADDAVAVLTGTPVYLIETLANKLAEMALTYPLVKIVEVTIHKPMAPVRHQFSDVSVTIRRRRDQEAAELVSTRSTISQPETTVAEPVPAKTAPSVTFPKRSFVHRAADPTPLPAQKQFPSRTSLHPGPPQAPALKEAAPSTPAGSDRARRPNIAPAKFEVRPISQARPATEHLHPPLPINRSFSDSSHIYNVVLALGSNQGDILANLSGAVEALAGTPGFEIEEVSPLVRTKPVLEPGALPQPDYYNAVVIGRTVMAPPVLLQTTQYIERQFGRTPGRRWSARTLDIDIISIDQMQVQSRDLVLPHPRAHERAFVLYPWSLAAPDAVLINDQRVQDLLTTAPDLAGVMSVRRDWLGKSGSPSVDEEELELAPRPATERGSFQASALTPTVEVRGEKLHLAPLEGDPIFQKLVDAEAEKTRKRKARERAEQAAKAASLRQAEPVVEESLVEVVQEAPAAPEQLPKPKPAHAIPHVEEPVVPEATLVVDPVETDLPAPAPARALPDWRFSVQPQSTRVVDDTSRPSEVEVLDIGDPTPASQEETPAVTPWNGTLKSPRSKVSRHVTLRPTPTGSLPVTRGTGPRN